MPDVPGLPQELDETVNLARLMMGGDRSSSAFSVFVDRSLMFCSQPLHLDERASWGMFYERLRNPFEVFVALAVGATINRQGMPLERGLLVQVGIEMFPSFYDAPQGEVPMPAEDEQLVGYHSVTLMGYDVEELRFRFNHLFSADWGQDGLGTLPLEYLIEHAIESTVFRSHGGPKPEEIEDESNDSMAESKQEDGPDYDTLDLPEPNKIRLRRLERQYSSLPDETPWESGHVVDDKVIWTGRRIIGAGSGDIWIHGALLLRGVIARPLLVGWMFGRIVDNQLMDIEEFFIWPTYRGRGLGTALAGRTLLYAAATQVHRVRWLERETDSVVNAKISTHVPSWLGSAAWTQPDESDGWGLRRVSGEMEVNPLLRHLGGMHKLGGVHLGWIEGTISVVDHPTSPSYGLVIAQGVTPPAAGANCDP